MSSEQVQDLLLTVLDKNGIILDTKDLSIQGRTVDTTVISNLLKSLANLDILSYDAIESENWALTREGQLIKDHGSHELRVLRALPEDENMGMTPAQLSELLGPEVAKLGQNTAFKNQWIQLDKGVIKRKVKASALVDLVQQDLTIIFKTKHHPNADIIKEMKRRKLIESQKELSYAVKRGASFTTQVHKPEADLHSTMLTNGEWRNRSFKPYNFAAFGLPVQSGHLHPLLKVREEFRKIFFEMGFSEMATNHYVECSFWNFDALFTPQRHPARDAQDTFFLESPVRSEAFPSDYCEKVKAMHTTGGYDSLGYRTEWNRDEACKNILRTHTTHMSTRVLKALAEQPVFKPVKYFSIDKVFRNESVDATHLAEFHQIEGLIADYDLSLGHLIGVLNSFYTKLGLKKLRFKPAYNPYTEPSMEIFAYHEGMRRWMEVGNSGIFRPEMLRPMGFPPNVTVIAWGLSLERPTMIKYGINNIRDLVGHKIDLHLIQDNPICRLDKFDA